VETSKIEEKCEKQTVELQVVSTLKTALRIKKLKIIANQ
jgi:hypothetical protein